MPTPAEIIETGLAIWEAWGTSVDQFNVWLRGTANGGPSGDGNYPIVNRTGVTKLVACPAKMELQIRGQYGAAVNEMRAWLTGTPYGGPLGNGTYPISLATGAQVYLPCPAKMAADTATIGEIVGTGSLLALTGGRNYATVVAMNAAGSAADDSWALVYGDDSFTLNGYYLRVAGNWRLKVPLASEALLVAMGENLLSPVMTQIIGRVGDPLITGGTIAFDTMFIWNQPVADPSNVSRIRLFATGTGTMQLARYIKSGTTVTKRASVNVEVTHTGIVTIDVDFPVDAGDYIGLTGLDIWTSSSNTADGGGWWNVIANLDVRTVGIPSTANRLEVQFQLDTLQQTVNAGAVAALQDGVEDLTNRMAAVETSAAGLVGSVVQLIGRPIAPVGGSGVSDPMFIWADPVTADGVLTALVINAVATGTLKLASYRRNGSTVTRMQMIDIPIVGLGLQTLTPLDFGEIIIEGGDYIGMAGAGIFTSTVHTADGAGWWSVNAVVPVRTIGDATTHLRLEASFTLDEAVQYVTAARVLALSEARDDHGARLAIVEPRAAALISDTVQTVGRGVPPVTGGPVSTSCYIWNAPIEHDGVLAEVRIFVLTPGSFTLVRWSRVGNAVHREDVRSIMATTTGAQTFTPDDFGGTMPFEVGDLVGLAAPGLFSYTPGATDNGGWWGVVDGLDDRTLGTLLTSNKLQAGFTFEQTYQAVTADSFLDLKEDLADLRGTGVEVTAGSLLDLVDWGWAPAANMKPPLVGGRGAQRIKRCSGKRVLAAFTAVADVLGGGAMAALSNETTMDAIYGTSSLKVQTTGGAQVTLAPLAAGPPVDVRKGMIKLTFKPLANIFNAIDRFTIELHSAGSPAAPTSNYHHLVPTTAPFDFRQRLTSQNGVGRVQSWSVAVPQFSAVGAGADLTEIRFAIMKIRSSTGNSLSLHFGNIEFVPNALSKARCIWSFDDGHVGTVTYSARQLAKYGFPAVLFPSPVAATIGISSSYMTAQQIRNLHDNHGWQIGSQAWTTESDTIIDAWTENQFTAELAKLRAWQNAMGVSGGDHGSYFSNVGIGDMIAYPSFRKHFRSMRAYFGGATTAPTMIYGETFPFGDPMMVRGLAPELLDVPTNGDLLIAHMQQAVANKGVAYFGMHDIVSTPGNVRDGFLQALAWLDANRDLIEVCTEEELNDLA